MRELFATRAAVVHPFAWVIEPLENEPTLVVRSMFGGKAVYLHGRFVLYLTAKTEPWCGVLVPTLREHHASLVGDRPELREHSILGKWLYLPESAATFERDAGWLVTRVRARDPRIGIEPRQKARRANQRRPHSRKQG
ncbi:hypothetical protein [Opitutus terrae]|uniref:TfoX N-terminal domain-containing protein n=1 Tax=Opitutus terrae (strain DSM 11246 / JCM 15787 / PB90-1) TaxID=452637 RepID=B1ZVK3_OPITP|nr:hypothetical protein [Opitutus terrae]ACB74100.1 conserved hypothetical protein [Opitutus terrae PB90-1]